MGSKQYGKRIEKKVVKKARTVGADVKKGAAWARAELVKNSRTVGRSVQRAGKAVERDVERGGKRIGRATRQRLTEAGDRLRSRRQARSKKA
ncbi:MAG: hypothetical protein L3J92_03505 [Thermoplasmata archaeon]|jgi:hypothetical protein|nr:hypothetical protein [Thermoplasmata archaeon]